MVNVRGIASWEKKNGERQRYSWVHRRRMVNAKDIAGNAEKEEWRTPEVLLGTQKKNGERQRYSWVHRTDWKRERQGRPWTGNGVS